MHPLLDSCLTNIFFYLWRRKNNAPQHEVKSINVPIPHTVAYEHNFPKGWYQFTEKNGILRNVGKDIDSKYVLEAMVRDDYESVRSKREEACDIVATYIERRFDDANNLSRYTIVFMNERQLEQFLMSSHVVGLGHDISTTNKNGLLQKYLAPAGRHEEVIQVQWTPFMCLVEKRRCNHRLTRRDISPTSRGMTYHGPSTYSTESRVAPKVVSDVTELVEQMVKHLEASERRSIDHVILHFKTDARHQLWFLHCPLLRFRPLKIHRPPQQEAIHYRTVMPTYVSSPGSFTITHSTDELHGLRKDELLAMTEEGQPKLRFACNDLISPSEKRRLVQRLPGLPTKSRLCPKFQWKTAPVAAKTFTGRPRMLSLAPSDDMGSPRFAPYSGLNPMESSTLPTLNVPREGARNSDSTPTNHNHGGIETRANSTAGSILAASSIRKKKRVYNSVVAPVQTIFTKSEFLHDPEISLNDVVRATTTAVPFDKLRVHTSEERRDVYHCVTQGIEWVLQWSDSLLYHLYSHFLSNSEGVLFAVPASALAEAPEVEEVLLRELRVTFGNAPSDAELEEREHMFESDFDEIYIPSLTSESGANGYPRNHTFLARDPMTISRWKQRQPEFRLVTLRNIHSCLVHRYLLEDFTAMSSAGMAPLNPGESAPLPDLGANTSRSESRFGSVHSFVGVGSSVGSLRSGQGSLSLNRSTRTKPPASPMPHHDVDSLREEQSVLISEPNTDSMTSLKIPSPDSPKFLPTMVRLQHSVDKHHHHHHHHPFHTLAETPPATAAAPGKHVQIFAENSEKEFNKEDVQQPHSKVHIIAD
eukprot:PhM_4_TR1459/c0_g1_i1/m.56437